MIIKNGENAKIESVKEILGISGDVYVDASNHIESLDSHRRLLSAYHYPSTAETIEEALEERRTFEEELERRRKELPEAELTAEELLEMLNELGVNINDQ